MLGKLLKYEFRASFWLMPFLILAVALLYGAGWLAKALGIKQLVATLGFGMLIVGIAAMVVALVMVITRFYKGLFGAEGYLAQTLPVGKGTLIASKAIVAIAMILCGFIAAIGALFGMFHLLELQMSLEILNQQLGNIGGQLITGTAVLLFIQLILFVNEVYFSITLANTRVFLGNSVLFSVLFYFATQMVVGALEVAGLFLLPIGIQINPGKISFVAEGMLGTMMELGTGQQEVSSLFGHTIGIGSVIIDIAALVVLLLLTRWLMNRKISVK